MAKDREFVTPKMERFYMKAVGVKPLAEVLLKLLPAGETRQT